MAAPSAPWLAAAALAAPALRPQELRSHEDQREKNWQRAAKPAQGVDPVLARLPAGALAEPDRRGRKQRDRDRLSSVERMAAPAAAWLAAAAPMATDLPPQRLCLYRSARGPNRQRQAPSWRQGATRSCQPEEAPQWASIWPWGRSETIASTECLAAVRAAGVSASLPSISTAASESVAEQFLPRGESTALGFGRCAVTAAAAAMDAAS